MSALKFLIEKELKQFIRNAFLPKLAFAFPIMALLVLPWAATMNIDNINLGIVDADHSELSKKLTDKIEASTYFTLSKQYNNYNQALDDIEYGKIDLIVEIPQNFEQNIICGTFPQIQISANGVNGTKGSMGSGYLSNIISDFSINIAEKKGINVSQQDFINMKNLYNSTLNYKSFMIPALMAIVVLMLGGLLPTLNIVSEKEIGTIEQMNVTPVKKFHIIIAKLIPYWLMGFIVLTICFAIAALVYGLVPQGNILTIYAIAAIFILAMTGFGLVISNYSSSLQEAMFVIFFFMIIFMLMSGLFTPISSMPTWAQKIAIAFPPRYFIEALRGVYLKGTSFINLIPQATMLTIFAIVLNFWAMLSYKKRS